MKKIKTLALILIILPSLTVGINLPISTTKAQNNEWGHICDEDYQKLKAHMVAWIDNQRILDEQKDDWQDRLNECKPYYKANLSLDDYRLAIALLSYQAGDFITYKQNIRKTNYGFLIEKIEIECSEVIQNLARNWGNHIDSYHADGKKLFIAEHIFLCVYDNVILAKKITAKDIYYLNIILQFFMDYAISNKADGIDKARYYYAFTTAMGLYGNTHPSATKAIYKLKAIDIAQTISVHNIESYHMLASFHLEQDMYNQAEDYLWRAKNLGSKQADILLCLYADKLSNGSQYPKPNCD